MQEKNKVDLKSTFYMRITFKEIEFALKSTDYCSHRYKNNVI